MNRLNFKDTLIAELIAMSGGVFAGLWLSVITRQAFLIPGIFILLPGFLELGGNIGGIFSAKLGSALNSKKIKPSYKLTKFVRNNFLMSFTLTIFSSFFLGLLASIISYFLYGYFELRLIFISLIAGILSTTIIISLTFLTSISLFKKHHDPDDVMGPYITTISDVVNIISLLLAIVVISFV